MELIIQLYNPGLCSLRVTLPDILVDSIQELENIFHLSVRNKKGKQIPLVFHNLGGGPLQHFTII